MNLRCFVDSSMFLRLCFRGFFVRGKMPRLSPFAKAELLRSSFSTHQYTSKSRKHNYVIEGINPVERRRAFR
jgi:hypothetical protein